MCFNNACTGVNNAITECHRIGIIGFVVLIGPAITATMPNFNVVLTRWTFGNRTLRTVDTIAQQTSPAPVGAKRKCDPSTVESEYANKTAHEGPQCIEPV